MWRTCLEFPGLPTQWERENPTAMEPYTNGCLNNNSNDNNELLKKYNQV